MKRTWTVFLLALVLFIMPAAVTAGPFTPTIANDTYDTTPDEIPTANDNDDGTPDIFQAINRLLGTSYVSNADIDPYFVEPDYVWQQTLTDGQVALIGMTAGNSNTLGYYTDLGIGDNKGQIIGPYSGIYNFLAAGTEEDPYPAAVFNVGVGTDFGWYLLSSGSVYYSEPGLNPGIPGTNEGLDHMMTFYLPDLKYVWVDYGNGIGAEKLTLNDPFLMTWEDLPYTSGKLGDEDYDDMIYLFDRIAPIPEPTTVLLFGAGLIGLWISRKKFK